MSAQVEFGDAIDERSHGRVFGRHVGNDAARRRRRDFWWKRLNSPAERPVKLEARAMMAHADEGLHRHREPRLKMRLDHGHVDHVVDREQQLGLLEAVGPMLGIGWLDFPPDRRPLRPPQVLELGRGRLQAEGHHRRFDVLFGLLDGGDVSHVFHHLDRLRRGRREGRREAAIGDVNSARPSRPRA